MAVMAEAAKASVSQHPPGTVTRDTPINVLKGDSKSHKNLRSAGDRGSSPSGPGSTRISLTSNWRPTQDASPRPPAADATPTPTSSGISRTKGLHFPSLGSSPNPKLRVPQTPRPSGSSPAMGPVISPTRQSTSSSNPYASTIRHAS